MLIDSPIHILRPKINSLDQLDMFVKAITLKIITEKVVILFYFPLKS